MIVRNLLFLLSGFALVACNKDKDEPVPDPVVQPPPDVDGDGFDSEADCDDANPLVFPNAPQLCDGIQNDCNAPDYPAVPAREVDGDEDGYVACDSYLGSDANGGGDCDDENAAVFPMAPELCDGIANNCSAATYPEVPDNEQDGDKDGFVSCFDWTGSNAAIAGGDDCDDTTAQIAPGAPELCDGIANDCANPLWPSVPPEEIDYDQDGFVSCPWIGSSTTIKGGEDCLPTDSKVYPGAPQLCDGRQNNCLVDTYPDAPATEVDNDGDGFVECDGWMGNDSSVVGGGDCRDDAVTTYPGAPELCDGVGNDCEATGWPEAPDEEQDHDGDGYVVCAWEGSDLDIIDGGDCADDDGLTYPGAEQVCDGVNNDCADSAWPLAPDTERDNDGDGHVECEDWSGAEAMLGGDCDDARADVYPGAMQWCDGVNNDCASSSWPEVPNNEQDGDGDGFVACDAWVGNDGALSGGDCLEGEATVYPGAPELHCDGFDNACDAPETWEIWVPAEEAVLQAAVDSVEVGGSVCLSAGIHAGPVQFPGTPLTVRGVDGSAVTTIEGAYGSVVTFTGGDYEDTVLEGVTITGGYAVTSVQALIEATDTLDAADYEGCSASAYCGEGEGQEYGEDCYASVPAARGGGLYLSDSSPLLRDVVVTGNEAMYGGGLYLRNSSPVMEEVTITDNHAWYNAGGMFLRYASPQITNATLQANTSEAFGAAAYIEYSSPIFDTVTVTGHEPREGAAVQIYGSSMQFTGATFTENQFGTTAETGLDPLTGEGRDYSYIGGALLVDGFSQVQVEDSTFSDNRAPYGAGLAVCGPASVEVSGSTFSGNQALEGAGAQVEYGTLSVTDSVFEGNVTGNISSEFTSISEVSLEAVFAYYIDGGEGDTDESDFIDGGEGAGILMHGGELTLEDTILRENISLLGAAISGYDADIRLIRSAITDNQVVYDGPALYVDRSDVVAEDIEVSFNRSPYGSTMYLSSGSFEDSGGTYTGNECFVEDCIGAAVSMRNSVESSMQSTNIYENTGGSALEIDGGTATISGLDVSNNDTTVALNLSFLDAEVDALTVADNLGGGIYLASTFMEIENASISGNGGESALHAYRGSNLIERSTFTGNEGTLGGAIRVESASLAIQDVSFTQNNATEHGGAVAIEGTSSVSFQRSVFSENTAAGDGGVFSLTDGSVYFEDVIFEDNAAAYGGVGFQGNGDTTFSRTILANNSATETGGGLQVDFGTVTFDSSVMAYNEGPAGGGGLWQGEGASFVGTNTVFVESDVNAYGSFVANHNVFDNTDVSTSIGAWDPGTEGEGNVIAAPEFVSLGVAGSSVDSWDLHAVEGGNLWNTGLGPDLDPDCSAHDIGYYSGPDADFSYYEDNGYVLETCTP